MKPLTNALSSRNSKGSKSYHHFFKSSGRRSSDCRGRFNTLLAPFLVYLIYFVCFISLISISIYLMSVHKSLRSLNSQVDFCKFLKVYSFDINSVFSLSTIKSFIIFSSNRCPRRSFHLGTGQSNKYSSKHSQSQLASFCFDFRCVASENKTVNYRQR